VVDGQIPGLDVAGLIAEHSTAARRLVKGGS
jgi:8-oxoguanine deaminase